MDESEEHDLRIRAHYTEMWGPPADALKLSRGPLNELPPQFRVLLFPPSHSRARWIYATSSMSTETEARGLELHLFAPRRDDGIVELMTATAHYHRTGAPLDYGHTINFGKPWMESSNAEYGLLSLPYLDGPLLEWLPIRDRRIRFLWIIPVHQVEVEFKKKAGLEALETLFEETQFDYLDPKRGPVIRDS